MPPRDRTPEFRETITLALQQAGLDDVLTYQDVERLLHMSLDKGNSIVRWWQNHKYEIFDTEDGLENVLLGVAGYALADLQASGLTDRKAVGQAFLDAMHQWRDQYRRQFDPGGHLPNGERFWLNLSPASFTDVEDWYGGRNEYGDDADFLLDLALIDMGGTVVGADEAELELDGDFEDPRLQAMWDVASLEERELLRHIAAGVPYTQAGIIMGKNEQWAKYHVNKLRKVVA